MDAAAIQGWEFRSLHNNESRRSKENARKGTHKHIRDNPKAFNPTVVNRNDTEADCSPYHTGYTINQNEVPLQGQIDCALDEEGQAHDAHTESAAAIDEFEYDTGYSIFLRTAFWCLWLDPAQRPRRPDLERFPIALMQLTSWQRATVSV